MSEESKLAAEYRHLRIKLENVNRQLDEVVAAYEIAKLPPYPGDAADKEMAGAYHLLVRDVEAAITRLEKLKALLVAGV